MTTSEASNTSYTAYREWHAPLNLQSPSTKASVKKIRLDTILFDFLSELKSLRDKLT
jgi:hypothetical protein